MDGYWDELEKVVRMARLLQKLPCPSSEVNQALNLDELERVNFGLRQMIMRLRDQVEVWVGKPSQTPKRPAVVSAMEWDWLGLDR